MYIYIYIYNFFLFLKCSEQFLLSLPPCLTCLFNTLFIETKHKCYKNFLLANKILQKMHCFFLSQTPTLHSFTFNS